MLDRDRENFLSLRESERLVLLEQVRKGQLTQVAAGKMLHVSDRWVRELLRRLERNGPRSLAHGNRGRPSPRRTTDAVRKNIATWYGKEFQDFNLSHFHDMLKRRRQRPLPCRETLRRILVEAGLWQRRRAAPVHRTRRLRREREGELLQMDASIHHWLGEDQPFYALAGAIDDATSDVPFAQFGPAETTDLYFHVLQGILRKRGVPQAFYTDRDSVFVITKPTAREQAGARGEVPLTEFGRALRELGIQWIPAGSPQAKGRIERLWGTFQDRLLKELRVAGIRTLDAANQYLHKVFLPNHNRSSRCVPASADLVYRPAPPRFEIERILCWKEPRILPRDHTFAYEQKHWQVLPSRNVPALAGRRIEIRKTLRGQIQAWYGEDRLELRPAPAPPPLASLQRSGAPRASRAAAGPPIPRGRLWFGKRKTGSFHVDRKPELFTVH